ncbi:MAG: DNA polymerase III subunit gamma/tau [Bacteroidaceae bacterium]|nr:DNA polymerase III subunit gamma/tau [Bacteroidaceae bacterium]
MEDYIVSARKYRPATFDTVVGQSSLTVTLKNAIKNGKLAHAYLFCGPRGVGKTTCARIFAKTINCLNPKEDGEACNECESCKAFNEQRSYNIHELDAASNNSVDDIRQLIEQVRIPPQIGKYKVFIIDEVHMLSTAAFNAFLKTLEEPPHHAIFILATTEKHKLLPTILSRCQIYDFNRMKVEDIVAHLASVAAKEGITSEPSALNVIAQKADGGMRDALSIFDQVASFCGGNITYQRTIETLNVLDHEYYFKIVNFCLENKITECMLTFNEILSKGFDGQHFINGLSTHFRNLLMSRDEQTLKLIEASDDVRQQYHAQAQKCEPKFIFSAMKLCNDCDLNYKQSQNRRLLVELTLIQVAQAAQGEDVPGSGRSPRKILRPLFRQIAQSNTASVSVPKPQAASPAPATNVAGAPAVASAPAPQTVTEHVMAPTTTAQPLRRSFTGFSILNAVPDKKRQEEEETKKKLEKIPQYDDSTVSKSRPLTQTELMIELKRFSLTLSKDETAMAGRFNNIEPTILESGETFEILAENPVIESMYNKYVPRVQAFIQQAFGNPNIRMVVRLSEVTERKKILSKFEQLQELYKEYESLRKLQEAFGLEMS